MQNKIDQVAIGVDIGSWTFKISAFNQKQFSILTNQANFRQTPSLVSFLDRQRLVGEQAQNKIKSNYKNTVRAPMRLIGLQRNMDLVEEELKYCSAKYETDEEIQFSMKVAKDTTATIKPEHLLTALLGKVRQIAESHELHPVSYCLTVPSYLSHFERKLIKRCGDIVFQPSEVTLIDDWLSLACEYSFNHLAEIRQSGQKTVVFVDVGYAKSSFFVIEFGAKQPRLLDCEHMRFLGSKNMDQLLVDFYDAKIKQGRQTQDSIYLNPKALTKMMDQIQKQRKILSANDDYHILLQSLIEDYDLSYNMTRKEFQKLVSPVLGEVRAALANMKSRMPQDFKVHSVQLIGGTSRMPAIKTVIKDIFEIQPSRTLNMSQSMARGANIYGAVLHKLTPVNYSLANSNLVDICFSWNSTSKQNVFYGQNEAQYKNRQVAFAANSPVPNEFAFNFSKDEGLVQLYIYYGHDVTTKSIGYLRFKTPNRLRFSLDHSKIVNVALDFDKFEVCKMQDKKETRWQQLKKWHQESTSLERRIGQIYNLKNEFESKFYDMRSKITEYKECMNEQEQNSFVNQFSGIEQWIEAENNRPLSTIEDFQLYRKEYNQLKEYEEALGTLKEREKASQGMRGRYQAIVKAIEAVPARQLNEAKTRKLTQLAQWLRDSYAKMQASNWEGYYLNDNSLKYAEDQLQKILNS